MLGETSLWITLLYFSLVVFGTLAIMFFVALVSTNKDQERFGKQLKILFRLRGYKK